MSFRRWESAAAVVAAVAFAAGGAQAAVPAPSHGGTYTIENGARNKFGDSGEAWISFNRSGGRLKVGNNGAGTFFVKGTINEDLLPGDRAGWRLEAPTGLSLRTAAIDSFWDRGVEGRWIAGVRWALAADGVQLLSCTTSASSNDCVSAFASGTGDEFALPAGTRALELSAECVAPAGCSRFANGSEFPGGNEFAAVSGATVTLEDATSPALDGTSAGGDLWTEPERWFHNGDASASASIAASDASGVSRMQWYVDGALAYDTSGITSSGALTCNFAYFKPCLDRSARFSLDRSLFTISDGSHELAVVGYDAAGNVSPSLARSFRVDDTPPPAVAVAVREGSALRDPGPWHLDFVVPSALDGSPLAQAVWQLCSADAPDDCGLDESVSLSGEAGSERSVEVAPPRRGEWAARLWLEDAAGNRGAASDPVLIRYGESAPVADPEHPPALSGEFVDGSSVHVSASGFAVSGTPRYAFQWQRCSSAPGDDCADIEGASAQDYRLTHADAGARVRARVTAVNGRGSASALSGVSEVVRFLAPSDGSARLDGTMRAGETVRVADVRFGGTPPFSFAYRWLRCDSGVCDRIEGADGASYELTDDDVGQTLRALVVATNPAGSAEADAVADGFGGVVAAAPPRSVSSPGAPSGRAQVGHVLTADDGGWSGTRPMEFTYAWQRCSGPTGACVTIAGAAGPRYELAAADAGRVVRVLVSAQNEGNAPVGPVASARSPVVEAAEVPEPAPEPDPRADPGSSPPAAPVAPGPVPAPPPPSPALPAAQADLSKIPGSLVAASRCKVVKANPKSRSARVSGVGRVKLTAFAPARVLNGSPLRLSLSAPKGKVRSVAYRVGGRKAGTSRRAPYAVAVRPNRLAVGKRQALVAVVKPRRGKARQVKLTLDVAQCPSVLSASVRFAGARAITRVRVDSRFSIERVVALLPRALAAKPKAVKLTLTGLAGKRVLPLGVTGGIRVRRSGRKITLSGLPAGYGIAQLDVTGKRAVALKALRGKKALRFGATLKAAGLAVQRLSATVKPLRARR